jgi:hypothetical protein
VCAEVPVVSSHGVLGVHASVAAGGAEGAAGVGGAGEEGAAGTAVAGGTDMADDLSAGVSSAVVTESRVRLQRSVAALGCSAQIQNGAYDGRTHSLQTSS